MRVPVSIQTYDNSYPYKSEVEVNLDYYRNKVDIQVREYVELKAYFNIEDLREIIKQHDLKQ